MTDYLAAEDKEKRVGALAHLYDVLPINVLYQLSGAGESDTLLRLQPLEHGHGGEVPAAGGRTLRNR